MSVAVLIFAGALAAQAVAPPAQAEPGKPAAPKKVCVEEAQLGSLFKKRICATPEEWEKRRLRDQENMSRQGGRTPSCAGVAC